jgi:hypothetical protein
MGKSSKPRSTTTGATTTTTQPSTSHKDPSRFDTSLPQFRKPPLQQQQQQYDTQIVLDDRFASVLSDPRFRVETSAKDKYGRTRKSHKQQSVVHELSEFYTVVGSENDTKKQEATQSRKTGAKHLERKRDTGSSDDDDEGNDTKHQNDGKQSTHKVAPKMDDPQSRIAYLTALSRGELDVSSSSSDDDDSDNDDDNARSSDEDDDDESEEDAVLGMAGVLDPTSEHYYNSNLAQDVQTEGALTSESSPYMAVQNLDWDHVRALDIFAIVSSFSPPGSVRKVQVFPSNFGWERMKQEESMGPTGVWKRQKQYQKESTQAVGDNSTNGSSSDNDSDSDSESSPSDNDEESHEMQEMSNIEYGATDFDPEKLRAYEASRLKYYFAVVEFASAEAADAAYKEVDGMEFEHSSAALDMRIIPAEDLSTVIAGRTLRDEATGIPSNYVPPEFIVSALQQTNVHCSWEAGDAERERKLTKYNNGATWQSLAQSDDLKAYIASDHSSDEDSDEEKQKASKMRMLLGLDSGDEDNDNVGGNNSKSRKEKIATADPQPDNGSSSESEDEDENEKEVVYDKEVVYTPSEPQLEEKIRSKLSVNNTKELTPWEKYLEKKKEKRREKRQGAREKRKEINSLRRGGDGKSSEVETDPFFASSFDDKDDVTSSVPPTQDELELLVAGDDDLDKDYDIRGLQRIEKNKDKKLRGARKRKETRLADAVTGADFEVNVEDDRFRAVLDGTDARFGIDRTDPNFKETPAMQKILAEQSKRRKAKRQRGDKDALDSKGEVSNGMSKDLHALVQSIKAKVKK